MGGGGVPSPPDGQGAAGHKKWIDKFAAGIGAAHVALVLQPDGPFALCAPGGVAAAVPADRHASHVFSALPNVSVYIDAGASDWLRNDTAKALRILVPAGIDTARGFALNSTHYASTSAEIAFGTAVVPGAGRCAGYADKHFVVNTASNGAPFNGYDYHGPNFDNAATCKAKGQQACVTLGIPPTADVANPAWALSATDAANAAAYVDGYLWIGRPATIASGAGRRPASQVRNVSTATPRAVAQSAWERPSRVRISLRAEEFGHRSRRCHRSRRWKRTDGDGNRRFSAPQKWARKCEKVFQLVGSDRSR